MAQTFTPFYFAGSFLLGFVLLLSGCGKKEEAPATNTPPPAQAASTTSAAAGNTPVGVRTTNAPDVATMNGQRLVRVVTLNSQEAVREFQRNVATVRQQKAQIAQLEARIAGLGSSPERRELERQRAALVARYQQNNLTMANTYGFSPDRQYTMIIEKSQLWVVDE